jgi:hypothetical protein
MALHIVAGSKKKKISQVVREVMDLKNDYQHDEDEEMKSHISERVSRIEAEALLKKWKVICVAAEKSSTVTTWLLEDEKTQQ